MLFIILIMLMKKESQRILIAQVPEQQVQARAGIKFLRLQGWILFPLHCV